MAAPLRLCFLTNCSQRTTAARTGSESESAMGSAAASTSVEVSFRPPAKRIWIWRGDCEGLEDVIERGQRSIDPYRIPASILKICLVGSGSQRPQPVIQRA